MATAAASAAAYTAHEDVDESVNAPQPDVPAGMTPSQVDLLQTTWRELTAADAATQEEVCRCTAAQKYCKLETQRCKGCGECVSTEHSACADCCIRGHMGR